MKAKQRKMLVVGLIPALAFGEFRVDLHMPSGIFERVWYFIPLFLPLFVGGRYLSCGLAGVLSGSMMAVLFLSLLRNNPNLAFIGWGMRVGVGTMSLMAACISPHHWMAEGRSYAVLPRRAS